MPSVKRLQLLVELLAKKYENEEKKGELTDLRDPFLVGTWLILGEHAKKNGQQRSHEALRRAKGISPGQLLDIAPDKLNSIAQQAGPYEDARAKRLYQFADDIEDKCGQGFLKIFEKPLPEARSFLEKELRLSRPFADYLLMCAGYPVFALDAKVVRVAARLGYTKVKYEKDFDKAYKEIQKALEAEAPKKDTNWLVRAHGLLHRLGNDICVSGMPHCPVCPLQKECPYPKKHPEVYVAHEAAMAEKAKHEYHPMPR
jgi:endonuclease III